ncbi:MAG: bifunctional nuclease family protein, partial [Dehalococcoidia bacterium]|nr:bifunctional nuclease family protein [Dehalococcoidia bacterium]
MPLSSVLPVRPNLEQLRKQAKDLLKAYRSGDPPAVARFRVSIPRYSKLTDDALVRLSLSLGDAQRVIAAEYGFSSWLQMRRYVERKDGANMIEMTVDHVRVNNVTNLRTVVLKEKESGRYLPIWIGQAEGDAIAMRLEGQEVPRPMTHRIMDTMIRDLGGEVEHVVVSDLVEDTFFAVVKVKNGDGAIEFDTRPSDAIALAVNSGAPVFAAPEVLDKAGAELD